MKFCYVYILRLSNGDYYVGETDDLRRRLNEHNSGKERTTGKHLPCKFETYISFRSKTMAIRFEKYLKTGSGFAFRNKHLV